MKKLLINSDNVILSISNRAEIVSGGILLDNMIYGIAVGLDGAFVEEVPSILEVPTVPSGVKPYEYCYNSIEGFILNPVYEKPILINKELEELKCNQKLMQDALDELIIGGAF